MNNTPLGFGPTSIHRPPDPNDPKAVAIVRPIYEYDTRYQQPTVLLGTREEAIFLLSEGGKDVLDKTHHILRTFNIVYKNRERIEANGHCIDMSGLPITNEEMGEQERESIKAKTNALVQSWIKKKPVHFQGLANMANWLQAACALIGLANYSTAYLCCQKAELKSVVTAKFEDLDLAAIDKIADELEIITNNAESQWGWVTYLKLVRQYALSIQGSRGRPASSLGMKSKLLQRMQNDGLFDVHLLDYTSPLLDEGDQNRHFDDFVVGLQAALNNAQITYSEFIRVVEDKLASKMKAGDIDNSSSGNTTPNAVPYLQQAGKENAVTSTLPDNNRINNEFFAWFCIAFVEINLEWKDPTVRRGKITGWVVYEKMRELYKKDVPPIDNHTADDEKTKKTHVWPLISEAKKMLGSDEIGLPVPKDMTLGDESIEKYIEYFRRVPVIWEKVAHTKHLNDFINKNVTKTPIQPSEPA